MRRPRASSSSFRFPSSGSARVKQNGNHPPRRGAVMIVALICLTLATLLVGALLKIAVIDRRQMRADQTRLQADWLAESALGRAAQRLSAEPAYTGEQWDIPADELGGKHGGRVDIAVVVPEANENTRVVTVVAVYPSEAERFSKRTKQITLSLQPTP